MAELRILEGWNQGATVPLAKHEVRLGRSRSVDLQVVDMDISREHAVLRRDPGGGWSLEDLGAKNLTYVNGQPVTPHQAHRLKGGDVLRLGNTTMQFVDDAPGVIPVPGLGAAPVGEPGAAEEGVSVYPGAGHTVVDLGSQSDFFQKTVQGLEGVGVQVRDRLRRDLSILHEVAGTVTSVLDLDEVLLRILNIVFEAIGPDMGCVLLCEEGGAGVRPRVEKDHRGGRKVQDPAKVQVSRSVLEHALVQRVAVLSNDLSAEFAGGSILRMQIKSALCVPFIYQDRVLGGLYLHNRVQSADLTEASLELATAVCNLTAVAIRNAELVSRVREEERQRTNLERYFSPAVVEQIVGGQATFGGAGSRETVTLLVSDIRGFTRLTEGTPPDVLIPLLNEYFSEMVGLIFEHGGTIDKFIGDAILAYFGGLSRVEDDADRAVRCAREMQERLAELSVLWEQRGTPSFAAGIGVHRGPVTLGNVGSERRREFTVLGDAVNVATRLSGIAGPGQVVISDETVQHLNNAPVLVPMEPTRLKGRDAPIRLYVIEE